MTELRTFDARIIGSITSGVLLYGDFSKVHEAIEFLAGNQVWTHELPAVSRVLSTDLAAAYPSLPIRDDMPDWRACADRLVKEFPNGIELAKGTGKRTRDPAETLRQSVERGGSVAP